MKNLGLCMLVVLSVLAMSSNSACAQEQQAAYNENSVYPIPFANQMYKKTIWRRMDLREKINEPFFSTSNEITKIMIDAVKAGTLSPYVDDSLNKRMSKEKFLENLQLPEAEGDDAFGGEEGGFDSGWGSDSGWGDAETSSSASSAPKYYFPTQLYILKLKEDQIFDKVRSRLYHDIISIEMIIPAAEVATGIEKSIGVFKYKDLEQLFRSMPDEAIWYNRQNTADHRNMADAFLLRLFNARVYKISNPKNSEIQDIYNDPKTALIMSQQLEHQLIEYEHDLWEY